MCLYRMSFALQELVCGLSRADHPMSRFTWGNRRSLKLEPEAAGVNVREHLSALYKQHYVPARMHLVVRGSHSLGELQDIVVSSFAGLLPNPTAVPLLSYEHLGAPFRSAELPSLCFSKSIKLQPSVHLSWALPPVARSLYRAQPDDYISHLLGHEVRL